MLEQLAGAIGVELDEIPPVFLGDERLEGVALGLGPAAVGLEEHDVDVLPDRTDGHPAEAVAGDVVADLEPERVPVEAEGLVGVVDGYEHVGDGGCHAADPRQAGGRPASPFLLGQAVDARTRRGRVDTFATQAGTDSRAE